ncbi:hypothetical protein B0H19DRAFT_236736 [Mycena capillaripes]|nr:hypothetical protein B0H19DRAFT_236736 [Mycena capillaripes]
MTATLCEPIQPKIVAQPFQEGGLVGSGSSYHRLRESTLLMFKTGAVAPLCDSLSLFALPMPLLPQLPVELVDLIIKNIDVEDKRTMGICSLVCRIWLALTRPILFRCIILRVTPHFGQYAKFANAHAFSILFRRRDRTTFLPFVKEIEIVGQHPWTDTVLPRLVRHLPGVKTLRLRDGYQGHASALSLAFQNLRYLVMCCHDGLVDLLDALPALEHVTIATDLTSAFPVSREYEGNIMVTETRAPRLSDSQPLQRLHTVELDDNWRCETIKYIMLNMPLLTTLSLVCRANAPVSIREAGPTLQTLVLIIPSPAVRNPLSASADPLTPRLKTLRLCARHRELFHIAATLLSTINFRPQGPKELVLELGELDATVQVYGNADDRETAHAMALAELDRVVHALPGLSMVRISVHASWNISVSLPLCLAAGKLLL